MDEILTREEIIQRYPSEWVLIGDPVVDEQQHVLGGKVLFHSKDREEMYRKAIEMKLRNSAHLYTGHLPREMRFVL